VLEVEAEVLQDADDLFGQMIEDFLGHLLRIWRPELGAGSGLGGLIVRVTPTSRL
jgi:hypothetical protein